MTETLQFVPGDAQWEAYRKKGLQDLYWFNGVVLNHGDLVPMTEQTHYLFCRFLARQTGIPEIDSAPYRKVEMPRDTGKSTLGSRGYAIWRIVKDRIEHGRDIAIMLANEKAELAESFLKEIKGHFETNELLRALYPEVIPANFNQSVWASDKIEVPRLRSGRADPTIATTGVGGGRTGTHPDLIIVDDMISREAMENARSGSWQIMHQVNRWVHQLRPILNSNAIPYPEMLFIGCIATGQRVLMADGRWRAIEAIIPGECVWSWDGVAQKFVSQRVTGVWPQGEAHVVEVVTGKDRHRITCTPNHPLLSASGAGGRGMRWHRADWFSPLSPVQTLKGVPGTETGIPLDKCWLMGFFMGDGWVTKYVGKNRKKPRTTYSPQVALGVYPALNEAVEALMKKYLGEAVYHTRFRTLRIDSNEAWAKMEGLSVVPGVHAKEKAFPDWIWGAAPEEKRMFLSGLLAADGFLVRSHAKKRKKVQVQRLSTASKQMADDAYRLALACGIRPTSIYHRTRMSQAPNSPHPTESTEYTVGFRWHDDGEGLRKWRTKSVTPLAEKRMVWDLSVEGTENFVCEGFVVHNTRWWHGDCYEHLEEHFGYGEEPRRFRMRYPLPNGTVQSVEVYRIGDMAVFRRAAIEHGQSIFPEKWSLDDLAKIRLGDEALFACNYMNAPSNEQTATFKEAWLQYYDWLDDRQVQWIDGAGKKNVAQVDHLDVMVLVDPGGFSARATEDRARAAIVVTGLTPEGDILILETYSEKDTYLVALQQVIALAQRYGARKIAVEQAAQQLQFVDTLRREVLAHVPQCVVEMVKPGGKAKPQRILGLESYFQRGKVYIGKGAGFHEFRTQYSQFPRTARVDLLDALAYGPHVWPRLLKRQVSQAARTHAELSAYYAKRGWDPTAISR